MYGYWSDQKEALQVDHPVVGLPPTKSKLLLLLIIIIIIIIIIIHYYYLERIGSRISHLFSMIVFTGFAVRCPKRICYKLCATVFKALLGMTPGNIADLCLPEVISERRSTLRSASTSGVRLAVPRRPSCTRFGDRAFCVAGPTAWNSL